jgi:hypothetical protein
MVFCSNAPGYVTAILGEAKDLRAALEILSFLELPGV